MSQVMTFKVDEMRMAMKKVASVVKPKGVCETSRFVVFDTVRGALWGDDGSTSVIVKLPALKLEGVSPFAIDGTKLAQVVSGFDADKEMKISLSKTSAVVSCGRSRFTIARLIDEKIPALPKLENFTTFTFQREVLATALADTAPFVAKEDVIPTLTGIYVEAGADGVKLTATNRHTLSHVEIKPAKSKGEARNLILKSDGVRVALSVMNGDWVHLIMDEQRWALNDGETTIIGRAISGKFPDYTRIIDSIERQKSEQVVISLEVLKKSISRLKGFAEKNTVLIEAKDEMLALTAKSGAGEAAGEDVIEVPVKLVAPVGVNIRYLEMLANTHHGDEVALKLPQDANGVLATREEDQNGMNKIQVVSPMRV